MPHVFRLALLAAALASGPALAQQAAPPAAPPAPPPPENVSGPATGWVRVCQEAGGRRGCVVSLEMFADNGTFAASAGLQEVQGDARRRLVLSTPLGMWIDDGVQLRVDGNAAIAAPYGTCLANGCFSAVTVTDALLAQMKAGRVLNLVVRRPEATVVTFALPLEGFAPAYDGQPISPDALEQRQRQFQADMARRAQGPLAAPPSSDARTSPPPTVGPAVPAR